MRKTFLALTITLLITGLVFSVSFAQPQTVGKSKTSGGQKVGSVLFYYSFDNCDKITGSTNCSCKKGAIECSDGVKKNAIMFTGKGDYITHKNNVTKSFTITFWMRTKDVGANTEGGKFYGCTGLIDAGSDGSIKDWGVNLCGDKIGFGVGETTIHSDSPVNVGKYVFVAATRDFVTGDVKLYINGKLEATAKGVSNNVVLDGSPDIYIGALHTKRGVTSMAGQSYYFGCMDELKVYNGVLGADKIKNLFDALDPYKIKPKPQTQKQKKKEEPTLEGLPR